MSENNQEDVDNAQPGEERVAMGMQSAQSKETPISIPPTITYGLQDTHTTILPMRLYYSCINRTDTNYVTLKLLLNDILQPIIQHPGTAPPNFPANTNAGNKIDSGFYRQRITSDFAGTPLPTTAAAFPATCTINNPKPFWWNYWTSFYDYYTVLGCEYEIVVRNCVSGAKHITVYEHIESGGTITNRQIDPDGETYALQSYKGIKTHHVGTISGNHNEFQIIKGYHKTGSAKKDVSNDGDVKTWTNVSGGDTVNTYKEMLALDFAKDPTSDYKKKSEDQLIANEAVMANIDITLKYTVQFKQLKQLWWTPYFDVTPLFATSNEVQPVYIPE